MRLLISLVFISNLFFSQENKINFVQYILKTSNGYNETNNLDMFLLFNDSKKIYFTPFLYKDKPYQPIDFEDFTRQDFSKNVDEIVKHDAEDNIIYENKYDMIKNSVYITADKINFTWSLKNNFKTILGYKCQQAQTEFRGRIWTVWFTDKVPTQFGPWKFYGLPGLILEARDNLGLFEYSANKIILNSDYQFSKVIENFFAYKDRAIEYKNFVEIENKNIKTLNEQIRSSFPKGTVFLDDNEPFRKLKYELSFEWEKESKKP